MKIIPTLQPACTHQHNLDILPWQQLDNDIYCNDCNQHQPLPRTWHLNPHNPLTMRSTLHQPFTHRDS